MTYYRDYNAPNFAEKEPAISPRTSGANTFAVGLGIVALLAIAVFAFATVGNDTTAREDPTITITPQTAPAGETTPAPQSDNRMAPAEEGSPAIPVQPDATAGQQG